MVMDKAWIIGGNNCNTVYRQHYKTQLGIIITYVHLRWFITI